ncbi:O-antigen ligase [Roseivirga sp. E12]|uniref:O-antigen ligase family protein n=1 Tax=Roseivirga sp. E12 TaxID=2819237 RepID=UPI001ABC7759|nr:O-antigen ligase family protein [Roseivirga sp. E12]MBO3699733.1 O-antigen ligase family protein [Roseivirga sp. E12]
MFLVAALLLVLYFVFFIYVMKNVLSGKLQSVFLYAVAFFPVYALFITINFDFFESPIMVKLIQYSKEVVVFTALAIWIFGQKSLEQRSWHFSFLDKLVLSFISLAFVFFIIGLGEATFFNRAIYLKNILLIGVFYFFGRNVKMEFHHWNNAFKVIMVTTVLACGFVIIEKVVGIHFHTIAGYAKYNTFMTGEEPQGVYGLSWTFEAEGGQPRYGAFFAHPLELAASMFVITSICIIYLISVPHKVNKYKYLGILFCAFICILFAYSRASFVAFFMLLGFMAFLLRYYKLLKFGAFVIAVVTGYVIFFAGDEILFFVLDTISFENSSSVTHIVDWLNAVESMLSSPMGIGLAMSGNAGGVEKDLIVGGENQYLIYGVQMGFLGMLLYIGVLYYGIRNSWRAFRLSTTRIEGIVPFVAAAVKFGLLLPLFTANGEAYIYVSLTSWWLIGNAETKYQSLKVEDSRPRLRPRQIELSS